MELVILDLRFRGSNFPLSRSQLPSICYNIYGHTRVLEDNMFKTCLDTCKNCSMSCLLQKKTHISTVVCHVFFKRK